MAASISREEAWWAALAEMRVARCPESVPFRTFGVDREADRYYVLSVLHGFGRALGAISPNLRDQFRTYVRYAGMLISEQTARRAEHGRSLIYSHLPALSWEDMTSLVGLHCRTGMGTWADRASVRAVLYGIEPFVDWAVDDRLCREDINRVSNQGLMARFSRYAGYYGWRPGAPWTTHAQWQWAVNLLVAGGPTVSPIPAADPNGQRLVYDHVRLITLYAPVAEFNPNWRSAAIVSLARQYEAGEPVGPVLGDLLEEIGFAVGYWLETLRAGLNRPGLGLIRQLLGGSPVLDEWSRGSRGLWVNPVLFDELASLPVASPLLR